jgi:hypothetical protein
LRRFRTEADIGADFMRHGRPALRLSATTPAR